MGFLGFVLLVGLVISMTVAFGDFGLRPTRRERTEWAREARQTR